MKNSIFRQGYYLFFWVEGFFRRVYFPWGEFLEGSILKRVLELPTSNREILLRSLYNHLFPMKCLWKKIN